MSSCVCLLRLPEHSAQNWVSPSGRRYAILVDLVVVEGERYLCAIRTLKNLGLVSEFQGSGDPAPLLPFIAVACTK